LAQAVVLLTRSQEAQSLTLREVTLKTWAFHGLLQSYQANANIQT